MARSSTTSSSTSTTSSVGDEQALFEQKGLKIVETLGSGSYATVKLATKGKKRVAVKVIDKTAAPPEYVQKFLPRELVICKTLRHPNIIMVFETIEVPRKVYIIMELADNGDVLEVIQHDTHIEEPQAGKWFYEVVDAVQYCHNKGIVHRDLKCDNLLLDKKNNIKITDFGFAKSGHVAGDMSETYCGSFSYSSPEILKGVPYEPRQADVWSLGIILFQMLFGKMPYSERSLKKLLEQLQKSPLIPPVPAEVSLEAKMLILKILVMEINRPSLEQIRSDPWFVKYDKGVQPEVVIRIHRRPTKSVTSASLRE